MESVSMTSSCVGVDAIVEVLDVVGFVGVVVVLEVVEVVEVVGSVEVVEVDVDLRVGVVVIGLLGEYG